MTLLTSLWLKIIKKIFVNNLEICDEKINNIINLLKKFLSKKESIKEKLFQAEIQVARNGEGMVTLIYHKSWTQIGLKTLRT